MPKRRYPGTTYSKSKRYRRLPTYVPRANRGYLRTGGLYGRWGALNIRRRRRLGLSEEMKWWSLSEADQAMSTTGTVTNPGFTLIDQGAAPDNMIGRKIIIRRITIRMILKNPNDEKQVVGNLLSSNVYRILLVQDRQPNGATASSQDIFGPTPTTISQVDMSNSKRFKILKEWVGVITNPPVWDGLQDLSSTMPTKKYIKYSSSLYIPVEYAEQVGAARDITEVKTNNLFLCAFSQNGVTMDYSVRIRFTDS